MPELTAWRVDKAKRARTSFKGEGAALEGGRWNSAGVRVVYLSANLAMAALEKYVHLPKPLPADMQLVRFKVTFSDALVHRVKPAELPANWRAAPPSPATQAIGDAWARDAVSAILAVPSVLIPEETNYLLIPSHPDFKKVKIGGPEDFAFEYRIARLIEP
ncbi:MAG TPA: RES family NAD+ phosphorylase [Opitutaceae bacterium]|nr:RES family NAD+ phosphorylase [Opitutaceae bacterium]